MEQPHVAGVTHRMVDVAGSAGPVRLHVAEAGRGEPVLLLHGWPEHWYCWRDEHRDEIELELVPDCGHWTPEERPDLVADRFRPLHQP